jgi:hypothetical protein
VRLRRTAEVLDPSLRGVGVGGRLNSVERERHRQFRPARSGFLCTGRGHACRARAEARLCVAPRCGLK